MQGKRGGGGKISDTAQSNGLRAAFELRSSRSGNCIAHTHTRALTNRTVNPLTSPIGGMHTFTAGARYNRDKKSLRTHDMN